MSDRRKGVKVYESAPNPIAEAAKNHQREVEAERRAAAAKRAERPVPNYICYPEAFKGRVDEHGNWLGGKLPPCRVCEGLLDPQENHKCSGYVPKYSDVPPKERMEMRRAAWLEGDGDWDDDQYDPTTPGDADFLRHEAETGETKDQVVLEGWDEDRWIAWKRKQLGLPSDYDERYGED